MLTLRKCYLKMSNSAWIPLILLAAGVAGGQTTISASPPPSAGLTFTQPHGGVPFTQAPPQTITISSTPVSLIFTASAATADAGSWLAVTPSSGTSTATVQVSVNAASFPEGTYTGTVTIVAAGARGSPIVYPVTLNVLYPIEITVDPTRLSFVAIVNAAAPAPQTVQTGAGYINGEEPIGPLFFSLATSVTTASGGNWLTVYPAAGTIPGTISVSVNPAGLAVGTYTGTIAVSSPDLAGATPAAVTVNLTVSAALTPVVTSVGNAASGFSSAVSPGEEVAIYGSNFGPATVIAAIPVDGQYPTTLSDTQVLFDGTPAPIIALTNGQINVMVPYSVSGQVTTAVQVNHLGIDSTVGSYNVHSAVPGIYTLDQTGSGQGAILNQDLSANGANNPAAPGSLVAVYMTGEGITTPASITGQIAVTLNHPVLPVTATVDGIAAQVQYAGSAPGLVSGVMQINVQIPATAPAGNLPIVITVGTTNTQAGVTVAVQWTQPSTSRNARAAWLNARRAGYTSLILRSTCNSFTRISHNIFCSISCSTHILGRNATPMLLCTSLRIASMVGISTDIFSGVLCAWNSRSTKSRYGETTLCAMKISLPRSVMETAFLWASRCCGETTKASESV
jgi:uncharacterized protein (TIGR03437 family)